MTLLFSQPRLEVHLKPGEVYCSPEKNVINTLLGSCVAVCLWDDQKKLGGMNHVTLPVCRENCPPSTRYANVATFVLYDMMIELGARREFIHARIFGGASALGTGPIREGLSVGGRNVEVTEQVLKKLRIPVVAVDVGGHLGRRISFDQVTGKIRMSYIQRYSFQAEQLQITQGERRNEVW